MPQASPRSHRLNRCPHVVVGLPSQLVAGVTPTKGVMTMPTGIYFPLDEQQPLALREYFSLEDFQAAVGGYVESIDAGEGGMSFFAHDEAKLMGLGINRRATIFWWLHQSPACQRDFLAGDVVLVGPAHPNGATLNVPRTIQRLLFASSAFAVEVRVAGSNRWHRSEADFTDYFEAGGWALDLRLRRREVEAIRVITAA